MRSIVPGIPTQAAITAPAEDLNAALTQASRYAVTYEQYATAIAHALESWPLALHKLSFPSFPIELSQAMTLIVERLWAEVDFGFERYADAQSAWAAAEAIISDAVYTGGKTREKLNEIPAIAELLAEITAGIDRLAEDGFERPVWKLGTISPKDSCFWPCSGGRVENAAQVLLLVLTSTRVLTNIANDSGYQSAAAAALAGKRDPNMTDDAFEAAKLVPFHLPVLWLRAFEPFEPHQEFRCFVKDGVFLGGTQYHNIVSDPRGRYFEALPFPDLVDRGYEYEKLLLAWVPTFLEASPYRDVVFDVIVDVDTQTVRLIETNPFANSTFPGLFRWSSMLLSDVNPTLEGPDGSIVWVAEPIRAVEPRISAREVAEIRRRAATVVPAESFESMKPAKNPTPILSILMSRLFPWIVSKRYTMKAKGDRKHGSEPT